MVISLLIIVCSLLKSSTVGDAPGCLSGNWARIRAELPSRQSAWTSTTVRYGGTGGTAALHLTGPA